MAYSSDSPGDINVGLDQNSLAQTFWKSYLYSMQQKAPLPKAILCPTTILNKPQHYGPEFHGAIDRGIAEDLVRSHGEGSYLVRESTREPGQFSLSFLFDGQIRNYRLYFTDNHHYVGTKRFAEIRDLVADGLITMYIDTHAAEYIKQMTQEVQYECSPHLTLNQSRKQMFYKSTRRRMKDKKPSIKDRKKSFNQVYESSQNQEDETFSNRKDVEIMEVEEPKRTDDAVLWSREIPEEPSVVEDLPLPDPKDFEKQHPFKVHNFIGLPWCDYCGNFMWGLVSQGVKCEDCGFSAHGKCAERVPHDCIPDIKLVRRVFGIDLTTLCKLHNTPIPFVLTKCVKEIELRGMQVEGVYRLSGSKDEVGLLQTSFEQYGEQTPLDLKTIEDINVICGCLKNFFRLLPIPLITYDTYGMFVNSVRRLEFEDRIDGLKMAVKHLPPAHYQSLKYFLKHLSKVTESAPINKMSTENLSKIFAPTLLRSPDSMGVDLQISLQAEATVVETLIQHQRAILEESTRF